MSNQNSKKFPYLVLRNLSTEPGDEKSLPGSKEPHSKRDVTQRVCTNAKSSNVPVGDSLAHHDYLYELSDPLFRRSEMPLKELLTTGDHPSLYNGFNTTSVSLSQMKAILTAQKELRKPAGSLYPSPSQISLIPETEMIYKKYFPVEECDSKAQKPKQKGIYTIPAGNTSHPIAPIIQKRLKDTFVGSSATSSASESSISTSARNIDGTICKTDSTEASKSVSNDKHVVVRPKDADARFRKRAHQQLVSLSTEVERLSSELIEIKKELKEVRTVVRKNSSDNDNSKSSVDSLSRQVVEMDGKLDCIQETVSSQEKSILSKLMLIGEMSDSDSDYDGRDTKDVDAVSSPSSTKLTSTSASKRPSTTLDSFRKACSNWIPIAPDFDKLLHAVALINYRMDRNQSMKLCTSSNGNGATFKHSDVIDLTLYKNGMVLGSTGFRSYSTMSIIRFVNELFNGFLPTELSSQYPDGVVVVLTDRRSVVHSVDERFKGAGSILSALESPPDLLPGTDINSLSRKQSMESILPSTTASLISLPTDSSSTSKSTYEILPDLKMHDVVHHGRLKMITLKMNDRKSGCKYKLKVSTQCTIKAIIDHISKAVPGHSGAQIDLGNKNSAAFEGCFDIILPVPYGRLSCLNSTLEEYGINQNTLVYIQQTNDTTTSKA